MKSPCNQQHSGDDDLLNTEEAESNGPVHNPSSFHQQLGSHKEESERIQTRHLSVGDGYSLQLVLLLEGIGVGRLLGSVDQLISQALGNSLDVSEGSFASTFLPQAQKATLKRKMKG